MSSSSGVRASSRGRRRRALLVSAVVCCALAHLQLPSGANAQALLVASSADVAGAISGASRASVTPPQFRFDFERAGAPTAVVTLNIDGSTAACVLARNGTHSGVVSTAVDMGDGSYMLLYEDGMLERTGSAAPPPGGGGGGALEYDNCTVGKGGWTTELAVAVGAERVARTFDQLYVHPPELAAVGLAMAVLAVSPVTDPASTVIMLYAALCSNGTLAWSVPLHVCGAGVRCGVSGVDVVDGAGIVAVSILQGSPGNVENSTLLGLRIADGSLVWTYPPPPARVDSLFGAAIVLGGSLWFGVADAPIHAGSGGSGGGSGGALEAAFPAVRLYGVNVLTGALVCRSRPLSGAGGRVGTGPVALSKPVVLNGEGSTIVVFTDGSGVTHALDAICQPLWEREIGAAFVTEHGMSAVRLPRPAWGLHTDGSLQYWMVGGLQGVSPVDGGIFAVRLFVKNPFGGVSAGGSSGSGPPHADDLLAAFLLPPRPPNDFGAVSISLDGDVALAAVGAKPDSVSVLVMVEYGSDAVACASVNSSCADCIAVGGGASPRCGWRESSGGARCVPAYSGSAVFPYSGTASGECGGSGSSGSGSGFTAPIANTVGAYWALGFCGVACGVGAVAWLRRRSIKRVVGEPARPADTPVDEEDAVSTAASGRDYVGLNS